MADLCIEGWWGLHNDVKDWKVRMGLQLSSAYEDFRLFCRRHRITCSQPRFTVSRLSMTCRKTIPMLKCKAWNAICICEWLCEVCKLSAATCPNDNAKRQRAAMMWGFAAFHNVLRGNCWLTDGELQQLRAARDAMLHCYHALSKMAAEEDNYRYPMKPKHHLIDHAERRAQRTRLNPGSHWAFAEEDNMGIMMKICGACHDATMHARSLQRWCMQFFWDLQSA